MALSLEFGSFSDLGDRERFFRVCRLLLDGATDLLREEFDRIIAPCDLPTFLLREKSSLQRLRKNVLTVDMLEKLYPTANTFGKSTDFDMTLLTVLFRHLCRLKAPPSSNNWGSMPIDSDHSLEADILRLKIYRNSVFAHANTCCIPAADFDHVSRNVCTIFERRGGPVWKLKAERMLSEALTQHESVYLKQLTEWQTHDADVKEICQQLDNKAVYGLRLSEQVVHQTKKAEEKMDELSDLVLQCKQEIKEDIADISNKSSSSTLVFLYSDKIEFGVTCSH